MSRSVLFVNQHYWPDVAATGQYLTDLAEYLAARGWDVTVLCGRGGYTADDQSPLRETRNGVHIQRVRTTAFGRGSTLGRITDYAGYFAGVLRRLVAGPRYDLTVVLTTPPLLCYAAAQARRLRGRRYAIWSMDLHPDAEEAAGMIEPGSALARSLHHANDTGYRNAELVVDLGEVMQARILAKGVDPARCETIGVWSDSHEVRPVEPQANPLRTELGLDGRFVVMYSGNAGMAHRFDEVLEVMRRLRDDPRVFFLFVGSGPRKAEIEAFIETHGIENARYVGYFPRERLAESLSVGDVHLLTLRGPMAGIAVPSKMYGILAAGRPTVMVGPRRSEPAQVIETHGVGTVVDPETDAAPADRLEAALRALADDPAERARLGAVARQTLLDHYDRPVLCAAWETALARAIDGAR